MRLNTVSHSCQDMLTHAPHVFQHVHIPNEQYRYENGYYQKTKIDDMDDAFLQRIWNLCGDQLRTIRLNSLKNITAAGLTMLCSQPHLTELHIVRCDNVDIEDLFQTFFAFNHPKLKTIKFINNNGGPVIQTTTGLLHRTTSLTENHLDTLHDRFGINNFKMFICYECEEVNDSDEQCQCVQRGCQPSTRALCNDCVDEEQTLPFCAGGCEVPACGDCQEAQAWKHCDNCGYLISE